jgi:polyisoprenoid-binding protein YceI
LAVLAAAAGPAAAQTSLQLDPAKTFVLFTLDTALHNVHGTFHAKTSALQFDPASGQVSGAIFVDARSGQTGNSLRDRKMHREVLESATYPDISFRPDRIQGTVALPGKSSVMVHGMFRIHGADREINVPAQVEMSEDRWSAVVHFSLTYEKWGVKNPSLWFLRVSDSVEIDVTVAGSVVKRAAQAGK